MPQKQNKEKELDPLYKFAKVIIIEANEVSVALLQRKLKIGYARASLLLEQLEGEGVVSPFIEGEQRRVIIKQNKIEEWLKEKKKLKQMLINVRNGAMITPVLEEIRQLLQAERKKKIMAIDKKIVKELPGTKEFEDILEEVRKKERERVLGEIELNKRKLDENIKENEDQNLMDLGYNQAIADLEKLKRKLLKE